METKSKYPCAFQIWDGGSQKSATYFSDEKKYDGTKNDCQYFIDKHNEYANQGNTVASLVICKNEDEYLKELENFD